MPHQLGEIVLNVTHFRWCDVIPNKLLFPIMQ